MTMTNYPGNTSLPLEVKERVVSTFKQAVDLYKQGRKEEVSAGCDFLLKMDPMFEPAKKLLAKSRNPLLDIDVDALVPATGGGAASLAEAKTALAHRDFQRALDLCSSALAADLTNEEAQAIAAEAREKLEAGPFIDQFCTKARNEIQRGNVSAARTHLAKAKALDDGHPSIAAMEAMLNAPAAAAAPAAGASSFDLGGNPKSFGFESAEGHGFDSFSFGTPTVGDSSFVVDNKPAAPAGAPASDFGFTFEEEQKPADPSFAFGGTTAPAGVGEAQTFDFATASVEVSADDQAKIDGYLSEGDQAFSAGDYQKAIDVWSRIFLIDVTNEQASERIEKARAKRLDIDRKIEDLITAGNVAMEKKDVETARKKFEEALKLDPSHAHAKDLLAELQSSRPSGGAPAFAPSTPKPSSPAAPPIDLFDDDFSAPARELNADILQIPDAAPAPKAPSRAAAAAPAAAERAASRPSSKTVPMAVAALLVILLAAGGWFGYKKFFGKGGADAASTEATLQQAQTLAKEGKLDKAISLLLTVPADDPQHDKVLNLLEDLKNRKSRASGMINGKPAAVVFNEQLRAGKAAFELHDYMGAKRAYEQAAAIQQLPPDAQALYAQASQQVAKLDSSLVLFKEGNYKDAIASLQALQQQDPENPNIAQLIASAHFNIGRAALQEERTADAMAEFSEVLKTEPNDEYAKRSLELATRYDGQPKDLLYKIYVKYLPLR